jgi:HlyD family secretion protein
VGDTGPRKGTVRLVEPAIDTATRMGRVRITINDAAGVRPGMYAMAEILVTERETTAAPITALGVNASGQTALKLSGDTARLVTVTTGIRDSGWIEILTGLAPGDQIVAKAGAFVRDGDRITPVAAQE